MDLIRLGTFDLFPSERLLCAGGKPVELGSRAFDVVLVFVGYYGRLGTKSARVERVWPRLVVDENNIPTQIASLRRVLGVGAIRTVQGYGYRLDLEVSGPASKGESPIAILPTQPPRPTPQRRAWPNRFGPLVGRDDDLRNVQDALRRSCLVTIVGIAGVGKTRDRSRMGFARNARPYRPRPLRNRSGTRDRAARWARGIRGAATGH